MLAAIKTKILGVIILGMFLLFAMFSETELTTAYIQAATGAQGMAAVGQLAPVHVMYALCGNDPDFFVEFETSIKSVLLATPHHRDLHIHLIANRKAYDFLPHVWNASGIEGAPWYRNVTITTYNVEPNEPEWKHRIVNATGTTASKHTFGAYYRLFAHEVVPKDVPYALYIDTDVLTFANLNAVFQTAPGPEEDTPENPNPTFIKAEPSSGVLLINVPKLGKFWDLIHAMNWTPERTQMADQSIIFNVGIDFPGTVVNLEAPFDLTVAHHYNKMKYVEKLVKWRPEAAIFHYSGGGHTRESAFHRKFATKRPDGVGLPALYFRNMPWEWVRYLGKSAGPPPTDPDNSHTQIRTVFANGPPVPSSEALKRYQYALYAAKEKANQVSLSRMDAGGDEE